MTSRRKDRHKAPLKTNDDNTDDVVNDSEII